MMIARYTYALLSHELARPSGFLPMAQVYEFTGSTFTVQKLYGPPDPAPTRREADRIMLPVLMRWLKENGKTAEIYARQE